MNAETRDEKEKRRKGAEAMFDVLLFPSAPFPLCSLLADWPESADGVVA
jgi:hypothetical protein